MSVFQDLPLTLRLAASLLVVALCLPAVASEPYVPADDAEVLETLPHQLGAGRDELAALRRRLSADPSNAALAADVAGRYVQLGKATGDPRFYGYARAALRPWWNDQTPPADVLRLRAKLKETDHDFDGAIADLKLLLEARPRDMQAWIELANLHRVKGEYAEAWRACGELAAFAGEVPRALCETPLQAVTGEAAEAYDRLTLLMPTLRAEQPGVVPWALTMQAEISRALGENERAERHYREALAEQPDGTYLLRAYGDFLLDRDRAAEALSLLRDHTDDTGVLVRAAIAAREAGEPEQSIAWRRQLERRFAEIRMRGGQTHGRFESRTRLDLIGDLDGAIDIAQANWGRQKEYRDTRNLLEAAIAVGDAESARPVIEFLRRHGTEDADLQRFVDQLEGR